VVLRNGAEIGRARVELPQTDFDTHVFTYATLPDGNTNWTVAGVPGHEGETGHEVDPWISSKLRMPAEFFKHIRSVITSGTAVLVTEAPVLPVNSGKRMTLISAIPKK
jgi:hypothetical protein